MRRRSRDPFWVNARRADVCAKCHDEIKVGERVFYYPSTGSAYCDGPAGCGDAAAADFNACAFDEAVYQRGY